MDRIGELLLSRLAIPLGVLFALAITCVFLLWLFQRRLIYFPTADMPPSLSSVLPGAEDISFGTEDGLRLGGYFVPASEGVTPATVLVFNGNGGNRSHRIPLATALSRCGLAVFLFDYRGYGENLGRPSELGLIEDARAAVNYLLSRPDVDPGRLIYFGESLGAAVAVAAAIEYEPTALVLRSPFSSMIRIGQIHYPFLPAALMLKDRYESEVRIRQVRVPLLVVSGGADQLIPPSDSQRLFDSANQPKRLHTIDFKDHNDPELTHGPEMLRVLCQFVGQWLSSDTPGTK